MNCPKCGSILRSGDKFCSGCGSPVSAAPAVQYCSSCGSQVTPGASFCSNCGKSLQSANQSPASPRSGTGAAAASKNIPAGESVIMDTGTFPIAYIKSIMSSINGKLSLTGNYLVFKAGHLQGLGGAAPGGIFIPNPAEAGKAKEQFSLPLSTVTAVEKGWSHITVTAGGHKYKFGGMTKTKEWEEAINNARARA